MSVYPRRVGFSLIELLAATTIIGILLGLLMPAIQAARESSRRAACGNNLRQIGLALATYSTAHGDKLPVGARAAGSFGFSWWVDCLPLLDEGTLFSRMDLTGPNCGWVLLDPQNRDALANVTIRSMYCPSSPLPELHTVGGANVMMPSYVGISGADDDPKVRLHGCCIPENQGRISSGGVLIPNKAVRIQDVSDGISKTLAVGECSTDMISPAGKHYRVDGGFPNGFLTGTAVFGTPPTYGAAPNVAPCWNITTIRYPPNMRDYSQLGIHQDRGANNPLLSAHPGGVNSAMLDGAVRRLTETIDIAILKQLATRDDGQTQGGP